MTAPLDRIDRRLLALLQDDARLTVAELAERVSLSTSPCWRRIRRLEQAGYIAGYHARLSPEKLGFGITAFVSVVMGSHTRDVARAFEAAVQDIPQVIACHNVSGEYDFLLEVVASDLAAYGEFARSVLQALPGVRELHIGHAIVSRSVVDALREAVREMKRLMREAAQQT